MQSCFAHLKRGLSQTTPSDPLAKGQGRAGASLLKLRPFVARHWAMGTFGVLLVALASLLSFPQPLIYRLSVDDVVLDREWRLFIRSLVANQQNLYRDPAFCPGEGDAGGRGP